MAQSLQQIYYRVYTYDYDQRTWSYQYSNSDWVDPLLFFDQELFTNNQRSSKISIQAPPGTTVKLNGKPIMIGRSGLYDLDNEDIKISSLIFPQPKVWQRNQVNIPKKEAAEHILRDIYDDVATAYGDPRTGEEFTPTYENFCNAEAGIFLTTEYTATYTVPGEQEGEIEIETLSVNGFQEASATYLDILEGEPQQVNGDLENVIVNYIAD